MPDVAKMGGLEPVMVTLPNGSLDFAPLFQDAIFGLGPAACIITIAACVAAYQKPWQKKANLTSRSIAETVGNKA